MRSELREGGADAKQYLEKVSKLVPSEIIAAYVALVGLVPVIRYQSVRPWMYWVIFVTCLVLTPIYLNALADQGKPKRNHLFLSTGAFVVWAYSVSGGAVVPSLHDPAIASITIITYSLVSGVIPLDR
jgi:hypothetical protein